MSAWPTWGRRLFSVVCQLLMVVAAAGCGYHVNTGRAAWLPPNIKTIAIPAFGNATVRYKLARLLTADVTREFESRTRFAIVADPKQADAVLTGALVNFVDYPTAVVGGRSTGAQVLATVQLRLTDRRTGKVLFSRPALDFRERYEISVDPQAYFDESGTAIERVSRDVARSVVTAILENF